MLFHALRAPYVSLFSYIKCKKTKQENVLIYLFLRTWEAHVVDEDRGLRHAADVIIHGNFSNGLQDGNLRSKNTQNITLTF